VATISSPSRRRNGPKFQYKHRSPEQWAAARGDDDAETIGKDAEWLEDLLRAASAADSRLDAWQSRFVEDMAARPADWGTRLYVSPRQRAALDKIKARLRRLGAL
jgi:hypothetical protein